MVKSGIRPLEWNAPVSVPVEAGMAEWKLYVRLFDEIDREYEGSAGAPVVPTGIPFLHIAIEGDSKLTIEADLAGFR